MPKSVRTASYELTFILDERATPETGKAKASELTELISKQGGKVTKEEQWGRRELAYEIKRNRSGFYVTLWADLPTTAIKPINQHLRFDESIIRSLVTKAYTTAQPGTLYPVVETSKPERGQSGREKEREEKSSAEEMLRRHSKAPARRAEAGKDEEAQAMPEEERLKQLDQSIDALMKDNEK